MKRKIATFLLALTLAISAIACQSESKENETQKSENSQNEQQGSTEDSSTSEPEHSQVTPEPTNLTGTWKSEANEGSWMEATISEDSISVDWVSDEGNTRSIYWVGTYIAPAENVDSYTWTSERNAEQTDNALLASTDDTKEFSYSSEKLSYSVSLMGTTTQMELSKE